MSADERLWVDDTRPAPEGWTWLKTFGDARDRLCEGPFAAISLDHNLGYCPRWGWSKTGMDLIEMLQMLSDDFEFTVAVHTSSKKNRVAMIAACNNDWVPLKLADPPGRGPSGERMMPKNPGFSLTDLEYAMLEVAEMADSEEFPGAYGKNPDPEAVRTQNAYREVARRLRSMADRVSDKIDRQSFGR